MKRAHFLRCLTALLPACGLVSPGLQAQQPSAASSTIRPLPSAPDSTTPLLFSFALTPEIAQPAADTLPDQRFRMYDPARQQSIDWATNGNLGASARPLLFETRARRGFDAGAHAFDLYRIRPDELRFYRNSRTFSEVFFSQGKTQDDQMLNARFSRTFSGGATFALDYRNMKNLGQFRYQLVKNTGLSFGIWAPLGRRYQFMLSYTTNTSRQQDNGGILTDTVFSSAQFGGPISAEVRLSDLQAQTRLYDWSLQGVQHLTFGKAEKRAFRATHSISGGRLVFKYYDLKTASAADSVFYGNFLTDTRGLRNYFNIARLDNTLSISTFKEKQTGRPSDGLAFGLAHTYFDVSQEPRDSAFSNLFAQGSIRLTPSDKFAFVARGQLGLLSNFGEYQLSGELALGLGKAGRFQAGLLSQRYPPSLLHHRLSVSKKPVWQNDFAKPVENTLFAAYSLPLAGFEATGKIHLANNFLYFDQNGQAAQTSSPLQVVQLIVSENLRLGPLRFDNTFALQQANRSDVLRLPRWFSKNSLYFSGKIFKKRMDLNAGVDFRMNSAFQPDGYQPLTGQFYLQDSLQQQQYPWIDAFVAFKVQTFRFFIRYENMNSLWEPTRVFYQTARYPQPFKAFRFGIAWRFMDSNLPEPKAPTPPPGSGPGGAPTGVGPRGRG